MEKEGERKAASGTAAATQLGTTSRIRDATRSELRNGNAIEVESYCE